MLFVLGFTGAFGQVFVFVTISKFGALNCALIGLGRKILSLLLSFVLYGHSLNGNRFCTSKKMFFFCLSFLFQLLLIFFVFFCYHRSSSRWTDLGPGFDDRQFLRERWK
jgi:UAA transporter family